MTFRVGQKVVCVDDEILLGTWAGDTLIKGNIYTITDTMVMYDDQCVLVAEAKCAPRQWWHHSHFAPLQEQGMSILRAIAANPKQKIREDA